MKGDAFTMPFDYKKEYKEYYMPPRTPVIVDVPEMNYLSDPRRCDAAKLKTVIRHPIRPV
jgi:hypothetical protein